MLVRDAGKAGLAVMIFGVAACASDPTGAPTATTAGRVTSTTRPPDPSTTSTARPSATTTADAAGAGWRRVQLGIVSAYLLYRAGEASVIDTGSGGSAPDIGLALDKIGLGWNAVGQVIVTHEHGDHQGSLGAVLEEAGSPPWYAGAADINAIRAPYGGMPVGDGDRVFDMDIIETPGHTPGHISVLDPLSGVLVAGDALNGENGTVIGANPRFTSDMNTANASVLKLAGFDYEVVLFGHGEPVLTGASDAVEELAASL